MHCRRCCQRTIAYSRSSLAPSDCECSLGLCRSHHNAPHYVCHVQVVQCLTELGLSVKHARISSDGGWFVDGKHYPAAAPSLTLHTGSKSVCKPEAVVVATSSSGVPPPPHPRRNELSICCTRQTELTQYVCNVCAEFHVSETPTGRVTDPKKLAAIKRVLSLPEHTGGVDTLCSTCAVQPASVLCSALRHLLQALPVLVVTGTNQSCPACQACEWGAALLTAVIAGCTQCTWA